MFVWFVYRPHISHVTIFIVFSVKMESFCRNQYWSTKAQDKDCLLPVGLKWELIDFSFSFGCWRSLAFFKEALD